MVKIRNRVAVWLVRLVVISIGILIIINASWAQRFFYPIHFRDKIERHARDLDVDPMLVAAIIRNESRFRSQVISAKGAVGLMQIMPDTARWIAEQTGIPDFSEENLLDPDTNIRMGSWYISSLQRQFYNQTAVVLAAYNAGRGNVAAWLADGVWDGSEAAIDRIPFAETEKYVRQVLQDYHRYHKLYVE